MSGTADLTRLHSRLDDRFGRRAVAGGAEPHDSEPYLTKEFLEAVEHITSFPGLAVPVAGGSGVFHPPATCYRLFRDLAGRRLEGEMESTVTGSCRRNEAVANEARLHEFTMREIVFIGGGGEVAEWRAALMQSEGAAAAGLGLEAELVQAQDLFFGTSAVVRGKRLMQQLLGLKYELVAPIAGKPVAISSFNLHRDFFTSRLGIEVAGVDSPHSGCVAYGLERWVEALRYRWGTDEDSWPGEVRNLVGA